MEVLDGGVELLRPLLQLLLHTVGVLPPFDLIRHDGFNIHCIILGEGGGRVDVGVRVVDCLGCILAIHQLVVDVDVLLDESRLVVEAGAVFRGDGLGNCGLVDGCLGGVGSFRVGVAVLLPKHSKIRL